MVGSVEFCTFLVLNHSNSFIMQHVDHFSAVLLTSESNRPYIEIIHSNYDQMHQKTCLSINQITSKPNPNQ